MRTLRGLIVDDNDIARGALPALAESEPDVEVVGLASNGVEAVSRASELVPDAVIMSVLSGMNIN
ncbi:MAG: DNA-binding response regulator, partial [Chloroflexi bacterium]|nr:DNA-binding response regulator [Chloroflexota bacterium]